MSSTDQSEINNILDDFNKGSVNSIAQAALFALKPNCTFAQVYKITVAFYGVLDTDHLQRVKRGLIGIAQSVRQALVLRCLACFLPTWLGRSLHSARLTKALLAHWPVIREWLFFFQTDCVYKESVELNIRIIAKRAIIEFLALCTEHPKLHDLLSIVISYPGITSMLFGLWDLETKNPLFGNRVPDDDAPGLPPFSPASVVLDSCMCSFSGGESWNWREIMRPFNDDPAKIAATALDHLEQDLAHDPINYNAIIWDTHLLTNLSVHKDIRIPLLMQHSMRKVTGAIVVLVSQRPPAKQRPLVAKAISYACWYIRSYVEDTDGLPWINEVVQAGLLPALLEVEPWLRHLEDVNEEDWIPIWALLSNILPKYTIFRSVLKVMGRSVAAIEATEIVDRLKTDGPLYKHWATLESLVTLRLNLLEADDVDETHVDSCQSSKCGKSGPAGAFKRCAGCLHMHYCSKECQTHDWKQGGHQTYCRGIQARRAKGVMSRISTRDLRFLDRIIASDLSRNSERISEIAIKFAPEPAIVQFNYSCIHFGIGVGPIDSLPEPDTCHCDALLHQKWGTMVELARNSKTPGQKLLVRAYIACGSSPKVKMQVIPMKRILPGYEPSQDRDAAEVGDTFEHFYSCAACSFTVIDQAFPRMTERIIEEKINELMNAA